MKTCVPIRGGFLTLGGRVYRLGAFTFEDHPYCGPIRVSAKTGDPTKQDFGPRSPFWPLYEAWVADGKQADSVTGECVMPNKRPQFVARVGEEFHKESK